MKVVDVIAAVLLVVGGLNWGLVGVAQFDLVAALFGGTDALLARLVYSLVGLSAIYLAVAAFTAWRRWGIHPMKPTMA
jgi:uncharacterized membrane protein YuzA (DUF378 family)